MKPLHILQLSALWVLLPASLFFLPIKVEAAQYDYSTVIKDLDIEAIRNHIVNLSSIKTRATGYDGYYTASQYIYEHFVNNGLSNVRYDEFNVTVPIDFGAKMTVLQPEHKEVTIHPLWPNLAATVSTPIEGVEGHIIYVREGRLLDFTGKKVEGSIVLMEFNSERNWLNAAKFGAKATIFIEPDTTTCEEAVAKSVDIPLSFPRFYIGAIDAEYILKLLEKGEVRARIASSMEWKVKTARNIVGSLDGTDHPERIIVLTAYYDSFSVIPSVAPGAEEATGIAALLKLVNLFQRHQSKYTLMFVALSGHHQGLAGSRAFTEEYFFGDKYNTLGKNFILIINIDLQTSTDTIAITGHGGGLYGFFSPGVQMPFGTLITFMAEDIRREIEEQLQIGFDVSRWGSGDWERTMQMHHQMFDSQPMTLARGPSITIYTGFAWRQYKDTPLDTEDKLNFDNLEKQLKYIYGVIYRLSNLDFDELLNYLPHRADWEPTRVGSWATTPGGFSVLKGTVAEYNFAEGWYTPIPDALVLFQVSAWGYPEKFWWDNYIVTTADAKGDFIVYGLPHVGIAGQGTTFYMQAYIINSTGSILYAPDFGKYSYAPQAFVLDLAVNDRGYFTVFKCGSMVLFDLFDPNYLQVPEDRNVPVIVNSFISGTAPDSFSIYRNMWEGTGSSLAVIFVPPKLPIEILVQTSYAIRYPLAALINSSEGNPKGAGYTVKEGESLFLHNTPLNFAENLYWLDESRLYRIAQRGATTAAALSHAKSKDSIDKANEAIGKGFYDEAYNYYSRAWSLERDAYVKTRANIEDTVFTAPFFAFMCIPFALLAEMLLFRSSGLRRVGIIIAVAAALNIVLFFIHPAYILADDIMIVIIGACIIILIAPVIVVIWQINSKTIRTLSQRILGRHEFKERFGTTFSFLFSVGVSNLRKRKTRTALALTTIVLITFSIASFTSIASLVVPSPVLVSGKPTYEGIFIRPSDWGGGSLGVGIGKNVVDLLKARYGDICVVSPRAWLAQSGYRNFRIMHNSEVTEINHILGMAPAEADVTQVNAALVSGRWFTSGDTQSCVIGQELANALSIASVPSNVSLGGIPFTVVGIVDDNLFNSIVDLDQEKLTPVRLILALVHIPLREMIIIPYATALLLDARIFSVAIRFSQPLSLKEVSQEIFQTLHWDTYFVSEGKIQLYTTKVAVEVMGWQYQVIPFAIACLLLLNILLGSIHERLKEISIYSSLGLSPVQVGELFVAESIVYAVTGGILGYICSMNYSKLFTLIQAKDISLNYSSTWVMISVSVAMLATVASSLYPMLKASKLVTPSLEREWAIPTKPRQDDWEIPLPFVFEDPREAMGLLRYLREFVESHKIVAAQVFHVRALEYKEEKVEGKSIGAIEMNIFLAPYEAGLRQQAQLRVDFDEKVDKYIFIIHCHRVEGARGLWTRLNRNFIDSIRKQLLLWRSLPPKERERYYEAR